MATIRFTAYYSVIRAGIVVLFIRAADAVIAIYGQRCAAWMIWPNPSLRSGAPCVMVGLMLYKLLNVVIRIVAVPGGDTVWLFSANPLGSAAGQQQDAEKGCLSLCRRRGS
jgi:hypothetical protein